MSGSVELTIKGSVDETATQQTGTLAGSGAVSVDIKDMSKTTIAMDYKQEDKVKISVEPHRLDVGGPNKCYSVPQAE